MEGFSPRADEVNMLRACVSSTHFSLNSSVLRRNRRRQKAYIAHGEGVGWGMDGVGDMVPQRG